MNGGKDERKVLVVDDEPQILTSIQGLLEDDLKVLTTADPEEALRLLKAEEVSVILSDQRMPKMTGDQFLMRAREVSAGTRVMITGYSDLEALIRAVNNGQIYAYVSKPWDPVALRVTVIRAADHYEMLKALNHERALMKGLVEHLPEGVCLLDGERRLALANPSAQEYLRTLGGAEVGEEVSQVGGRAIEDLLGLRTDGLPCEVAVEGPPRRIFEIAGRPIPNGTSEGGWALVIQDVTQEREVLERVQQQDRLAAVGQMAAGIAHDFNNLLSVMMGFAQLIEIQPDTPESARRDLQTIFSQGQRASQMIRQILDFSRRSVVERQPVDLAPFLKETVKLLTRTLPENVRVASGFRDQACVVEANLTQLQQVITNLAVNARDAMPEGGELRIELSHLHAQAGGQPPLPGMGPGEWVVWSVSDTGTGMPPEVVAHIYEPFFTTKKPGQGTGLGMAQVYGIVQQHGGYIDVKSAVGRGTTFTIYLPRVTRTEALPRKPEGDLPRGRGETVLVVEDQEEVRGVVRAMLEGLNYRVLTATDGHEALAVYDRRRAEIALVLTDMVMPEMSGMELMRALKQRDPAVRVAVMTGYPLKEGGELPPGIVGWLDKPLAMDQVAQVVSEALKTSPPSPLSHGERGRK